MTSFKWITQEYHHTPKSDRWIITLAVIGGLGAFLSILSRNGLLAILIVIASFLFIFFGIRKPRDIQIIINKEGITLEETLYEYENIDFFWVQHKKELIPYDQLFFQPKKNNLTLMNAIISEEIDIEDLKLFLKEKISYHEPEGSQIHSIIDQFGL